MPGPERHGTTTRGFLFADLRGYTAFVERHGAHRAAAMLDRYRLLVRAAVAEFEGAEIRTEGDSFYVVFDSASSAIECGLAIVERAAEAAAEDPSTAFQVGIGVHAGETVETAEGYVGSAVNTAARICAQAGPNQVLVSGTVRALTAGVVAASFVLVGRRRLKGLAEPIELWRAVGGTAALPRQRLRGTRNLAVGLGALGLVGLLAVVVVTVVRPDLGSAGDGTGGASASLEEEAPQASDTVLGAPDESAVSGIDAPYPNTEEQQLLALVERDTECERALARDAPGVWFRDSPSGATGPWVKETIQHQGGITCPVGRSVGPDTVWYWHIELGTHRGLPTEPVELVRNHAGRFGVFPGGEGCAASHRAVEDWTFGGTSGLLLCYSSSDGDAIIEWGYDEGFVLGRAVRHDGDMAALLGWWADNARFAPTPAASVSPDAFPNSYEEELLTLIPETDHDRCERAPDSDVPVLDDVVIAGVPARTFTERQPISTWGGIYCQLGGIGAPDEVWYWRIGAREEAAEFIAQHAPKVGAAAGSCDEAPASERWALSNASGRLLCYTTQTGDAVLTWTYDQTAILGRAIRDDMDMAALLDWWRSEARFLPD